MRRTVTIMMFPSSGIATRSSDAASQRELVRSNVDDIEDVGLRNVPTDEMLSYRRFMMETWARCCLSGFPTLGVD